MFFGEAMRQIRFAIALVMVLIAALAVDLAVLKSIPAAMNLSTRIGLFGVLPMMNLLAVLLVFVVSSLMDRGEVSFARLAFLFVGGLSSLVVIYLAILEPLLFFDYVELTAGTVQNLLLSPEQRNGVAQGHLSPPLYNFGEGGANPLQALLACASVTPLILVPALLAGWMARGYRMKLLDRQAPSGRTERDVIDEPTERQGP